MKRRSILYTLYLCAMIALTTYFSLFIIHSKNLPTGKFAYSVKEDNYFINEGGRKLKAQLVLSDINHLLLENGTLDMSKNSEGFKDYEHKIIKPNNTFRIVALGDSFTEGEFISKNDTWPKQLERKLNYLNTSTYFEVLNLGRGGAGTLEELKIFKETGLKYNPDLVILLFYPNDYEDSLWIKKRANELWEMYKNGSLKFSEAMEKEMKELNVSRNSLSLIMSFKAHQEFNYYSNQIGMENIWKENVETPLTELIDICNKEKIELIVVGLDLSDFWINKQGLLTNFLAKNKIDLLDLSSYFPLNEKNELRLPDSHLNEKGYDLLSTKVLDFLLQSNILRSIKT